MDQTDEPRLVPSHNGLRCSDEIWIQTVNGGHPLYSEAQAWAYFLHQNLIDTESDNWNLFAQFSDDPTFTYDRLQQELRKMQGKQYHFSLEHSAPPNYWVLQEIDQQSLVILETWVFVGIEVYKCNTIYDLIQSRLLSVTEHLSSSMKQLELSAPQPSIREIKFWQSQPVQLPGEDEPEPAGMAELTTATNLQEVESEMQVEPQSQSVAINIPKAKAKPKKPIKSDMALLWAIQTMQQALPDIMNDSIGKGDDRAKTSETARADELLNLGAVPTIARPGIVVPLDPVRGTKRTLQEPTRETGKQARFAS